MGDDLNNGIGALFKACPLLFKPGIRTYVIVPLLINITLFALLLWLAGFYYADLLHWVDQYLPSWLQWLNWLFWLLFIISGYLIFIYGFTLLANIVAAPFNGLLSERVQRCLTQEVESGLPWHQQLMDMFKSIGRACRAALYYLPRALFFLILFLIPGINIIAGFCWLFFNGWMMTIQYMDYPAENNHISFATMLQQLRQQRLLSFSYGLTVIVATMIPIINFVIMPLAVISATQLWLENYSEVKNVKSI